MTDRRYQYARSIDDDVLAAWRTREGARTKWREQSLAWAKRYGADSVSVFNGWGRRRVIGLDARHAPQGWTKPDNDGVSRPKKGTPEYAEMTALAYTEPPIPGLREVYERRDWSRLSPGARFELDGAVYFGLPWVPDEPLGEQWRELLPSEYDAARSMAIGRAVEAAS